MLKTNKIWLSFFKLQSIMSGMFFDVFLFISTPISCVPISPGSAEADIEWGGNLKGRLIASGVRNVRTKNDYNLMILLQVTINNGGDLFWDTV